jgi:hypothetical protein
MTRWKASAIHFAISFAVLASIFALVLWRWYPPALFGMAKAGTLLSVLAGVDLVLGPLLTLLIYRHGKKGLKFDLAFIAIVQIAALAFGLHTVWESRPAYIVGTSDRFRLVFANEIDPPSAAKATAEYRHTPWFGPKVVSAPLPDDKKARFEAMIAAMTGLEIQYDPSKYAAYPAGNGEPVKNALAAREVLSAAPAAEQTAWQNAFARHPEARDPALLPLQSTRGSASVLLDRADGRILGYVALDPWPVFTAATQARMRIGTAD